MNAIAFVLGRFVNRFLGGFGLHLGRIHSPFNVGNRTICGSFPPYGDLQRIGARDDYFIREGYQHRTEYCYYDDRSNSDAWQDEVYRYAREISDLYSLQAVADVGCGSGYKLLKYLKDRKTIGLDVAKTHQALVRRYPQRQWAVSDFDDTAPVKADLVIAADVIEHVLDPNQLLDYILRINPQYVVFSTPDRNLIGAHKGPPMNPNHIREWSMAEFHAYLSDHFEILEHFHSNSAQGTQCVLARPRVTGSS